MKRRILFFLLLITGCGIAASDNGNLNTFIKNNKIGKIVTGDINKDNIKDYIIEYSNILDGKNEYDEETLEEFYEEGKNQKCLKFFISEGKKYRVFNSCKLIAPIDSLFETEIDYKIENQKITILSRKMSKMSGFSDECIEIKYTKNQLVVDNIYSIGYTSITDEKTGKDDYKMKKYPRVEIKKSINDFNAKEELEKLYYN